MKVIFKIVAFLLIAPWTLSAQQVELPPELAELDAAMSTSGHTLTPPVAAEPAPAATQAPQPPPTEPPSAPQPLAAVPAAPSNTPTSALATGPVSEPVVVDASTEETSAEFTALPVAPPSTTAEGASAVSEDLITIALDDVEMIDVVRMFSRIANANIIATPSNLTARVTANLDGVAWRPALSSILSMHSLALIERPQGSGVYSIIPQPPDAPEPMIVETLFLEYTTVDEVRPVVEKMLHERGSLSTFSSRNAMVIRSTESNLNEIRLVVHKIDIQSQQVCIETQFMELNDSAVKQLGIRWDSLGELGVGLQAGPFVSKDERTRVTSREDAMSRADRRYNIDRYDQRYDMFGNPYEGASSVTITERPDGPPIETVTIDSSSPTASSPTRQISRGTDLSQDVTSDITDTFTRTLTESSAAILNVANLNMVLSALKQTDGVSIVSNPKVIVANGTTNAFFRVGEQEPIIKTTRTRGTPDSPGDEIVANLDTDINTEFIRNGYLHTGIELKVIPTVKTDNLIEAQIEPSLRRKLTDKTVGDNSWPVVSVKEIKTKFTLQSGQTVAIGGLTDTTDSKRTSKVPLLGDIPILGKYLFSHTKDVKSQVETIIFVSLSLVEPRELADEEGIPLRAELVHKARIKQDLRKKDHDAEIRRLRQAATALEAQEAETPEAPAAKDAPNAETTSAPDLKKINDLEAHAAPSDQPPQSAPATPESE